MDGSYSKRAVRKVSGPKKKPATAVKATAESRDETGRLCNRIGCCGRLNHDTKVSRQKSLEKTKPLKPSLRPSSSKNFKGGSSENSPKSTLSSEKKACSKTESSRVPRIQELGASGSHISKSNSESNNGRRKRLTQGESSSSGKGKKIIGVTTNEARASGPKNTRNVKSCRANGVSSVGTEKPLNLKSSKRSTNQQSSSVITNVTMSQESSLDGDSSTSEVSMDRASGRRGYNIDRIADVLLALDRYEQDEELTYEQLLSLEASLFLGGLNFYDQHRDMRLDIDNMSYEELLVLEEKMGTVSTALSEEELSKCIKTSIYEPLQLVNGKTKQSLCADDSKCSICQEEFVRGDEVGRLGCGHGYHTPCISQWLGLKNWCPICKASPTA